MTPNPLKGKYYEYVGRYMDTHEIRRADIPVSDARREAFDTESDLYETKYQNGVLTSIKVLVGNQDGLDYPRTIGKTYYEDLPEYLKNQYRMLSRMHHDCKYVLGCNNRGTIRYLRNGSVADHIAEMRRRWNAFGDDEKPEWLTLDQIADYEKRLLALDEKEA